MWSLWRQLGDSALQNIKIMDGGTTKRSDGTQVEILVKVTRDSLGNLFFSVNAQPKVNFLLEGTVQGYQRLKAVRMLVCFIPHDDNYLSLLFSMIAATGKKAVDKKSPFWEKLSIIEPDTLQLQFSEPVDLSNVIFLLNGNEITPKDIDVFSTKPYSVKLTLNENFDKGKIYTFELLQVTDLAGNVLIDNIKQTGIIDSLVLGDFVVERVMVLCSSLGYRIIEIYNASAKTLDVSGITLTTT
jgi:hypothetical protein